MRSRRDILLGVLTLATIFIAPLSAQTTVTFQQNVGGYSGLTEIIIGNDIDNGDGSINGADVETQFLDGRYNGGSDKQALMKFDGLLTEIPAGATITDATLEFATSEVNNAQSGGPYGVSQLLMAFDATTSFNTTQGGWRFENGLTERPLANGFVGNDAGLFTTADVTSIVQNWVDGEDHFGFAVTAGTTDGWSPFWSGVGTMGLMDPLAGPKLTVTYTTDPQPQVASACLVQSASDTTNTMYLVDSVDDVFEDADLARTDGEFLDGGGDDRQALIRFNQIFEADGGQVPDEATITKATLVITTADSLRSSNSGTGGEYGVRQILSDWDGTSTFADLSFDAFVDGEDGLIADALAVFDVTSILQSWQDGSPNFGINLATTGTTDGWAILPSASTEDAPKLIVEWESTATGGTVTPASVSVAFGSGVQVGVSEISQSDNVDVSVVRSSSDIQSRTGLEMTATSPLATPTSIDLTVEGSVFARSAVTQTVELWNYNTSSWEEVDSQNASRFSDATVNISVPGDVTRFVESGTQAMMARLRFNSSAQRQQFSSNTDLFQWDVN